jgi:hypothetical protein
MKFGPSKKDQNHKIRGNKLDKVRKHFIHLVKNKKYQKLWKAVFKDRLLKVRMIFGFN